MPKKHQKNSNIQLSRRGFLTSIAGAAVTLTAPNVIASTVQVRDRELSFHNTHTGEKLSATFWSDGKYQDDSIEEINWILRDHRAGIASPIDPKLLDLLYQLQTKVEHQGEFHVISGYRSPATNDMLNKHSSGVAKRSYHMQGKAIDVRMPGFDSRQLHKAAISLKGGGVGYYSSSNFVHLDVGRVRYW
ncbi:MAG: DUF882 domain-containing protein [Gammaproteobacteria bacterium]|jgi:uncharacterized protein YcbK (DUF882 family)|nr:DUF882 domain-containing protein [Gammaproteobacteria bacterium]